MMTTKVDILAHGFELKFFLLLTLTTVVAHVHLFHLDLMAKRETLLKWKGNANIALWWLKPQVHYSSRLLCSHSQWFPGGRFPSPGLLPHQTCCDALLVCDLGELFFKLSIMQKHNVPTVLLPPSLNVQYAVCCKIEQPIRFILVSSALVKVSQSPDMAFCCPRFVVHFQNVLFGWPAGLTAVLSFTVYCWLSSPTKKINKWIKNVARFYKSSSCFDFQKTYCNVFKTLVVRGLH